MSGRYAQNTDVSSDRSRPAPDRRQPAMIDRREAIPHVPDLAAERLADVVAWSETKKGGRTPAAYRIRPEGQQLIYDAMARNAALAHRDPTQAPHRLVFTAGGTR